MRDLYVRQATVVRVIDGDTVAATIALGFYVTVTVSLRLVGLNAREISQPGGIEARNNLAGLLPEGTVVTVQSLKPDKYSGRADAVVLLPSGQNLNKLLLDEGWAAPYDGIGHAHDHIPTWPRP